MEGSLSYHGKEPGHQLGRLCAHYLRSVIDLDWNVNSAPWSCNVAGRRTRGAACSVRLSSEAHFV